MNKQEEKKKYNSPEDFIKYLKETLNKKKREQEQQSK